MILVATTMMMTFLISPVAGFGPGRESTCTRSGCWFSYTNFASEVDPSYPVAPNFGRCGEVDAAPRMPTDIWADKTAVENYVKVTQQYRVAANRGLNLGKCNHNPLFWYQNGTANVGWFNGIAFVEACEARGCCVGNKCPDTNDDPRNHLYCSLCGKKFNSNDEVTFWYPRSETQNIVQLAQSQPTLSTLVTAVVDGNLVNLLSAPGPLTVFAPNNDAFNKIPVRCS
jgi:hypothetical protein